jgi:hypothetical protein
MDVEKEISDAKAKMDVEKEISDAKAKVDEKTANI